jgi:hypothetical protein
MASKREREENIFAAFLRVSPDFLGEKVVDWEQPEDEKEFPDVICKTESGRRVGVEIGEWLNQEEFSARIVITRLQRSFLDAIGEQGENQTNNIGVIVLSPAGKKPIKPADIIDFRSQLFSYIKEVDRRWPNEEFWQGRGGYRAPDSELIEYPLLKKYLTEIHFHPSKWEKLRQEGQNWIMVSSLAGWVSEETTHQTLLGLLKGKATHYGRSGTGFDSLSLVIYYDRAVLNLSPAETRYYKFEDHIQDARNHITSDMHPFNSIFLFIALDEGRVLRIV